MTFLETEIKEFSRSTENNNQKTRSLIRNLKYVLDIVADGKGLYGERI